MKFEVTMKTPDAFDDVLDEAVYDELHRSPLIGDALDELEVQLRASGKAIKEKWFRFGELVTLEIDTDAGTCVVKEV